MVNTILAKAAITPASGSSNVKIKNIPYRRLWLVSLPRGSQRKKDRILKIRSRYVLCVCKIEYVGPYQECKDFYAIILLIMGDEALELVLQRQANRYAFLRFVFDESKASEMNYVPDSLIKEKLNLTDDEHTDIWQYLKGEYLLGEGTCGETCISHYGIVEIEESILNPDRSTEHFLSIVIQNFYGSVYGGVQSGGQNNTQTVSVEEKKECNETS